MNYYDPIRADLELINALSEKKYRDEVISIILEGSYGRKEGAFTLINNILYPINDYDITIVTQGGWNINMYNDYKKLVTKMKIPRIDINIISKDRLNSKRKTLLRYDRINNSQILFGNKNILNNTYKFEQKKIPFREKEQLFYTRFIGLLLYKYNNNNNKLFNLQQLSKSVISGFEANLLMLNKYQSSYVKNRDQAKISKQYSIQEKNLIDWAYKIKLNPNKVIFDNFDEADIFNRTIEFTEKEFLKLRKSHCFLLQNNQIYLIYFWVRPKRIAQIFISILKDKIFLKDLMITYLQLLLIMNRFLIPKQKVKRIIKLCSFIFNKEYKNISEVIEFVIKTRMGWN